MIIMGIQVRNGWASDLDFSKLLLGEFAYISDAKKLYISNGDGTYKTIMLQENFANGWSVIPLQCTYASLSSFTVPGDIRGYLGKSDKIMLTQDGSVKYFYVYPAPTYSGGITTVPLIGGSDFSLSNTPITLPYFSKVETPVGFPDWLNWSPTYGAAGSMTYTSVTTAFAKFKLTRNEVEILLYATGTTGGTANNTITFTLHILNEQSNGVLCAHVPDLTATSIDGNAFFNSSGIIGVRRYDSASYGLGTGRTINVSGGYSVN
jgi:hypothetical protein